MVALMTVHSNDYIYFAQLPHFVPKKPTKATLKLEWISFNEVMHNLA